MADASRLAHTELSQLAGARAIDLIALDEKTAGLVQTFEQVAIRFDHHLLTFKSDYDTDAVWTEIVGLENMNQYNKIGSSNWLSGKRLTGFSVGDGLIGLRGVVVAKFEDIAVAIVSLIPRIALYRLVELGA